MTCGIFGFGDYLTQLILLERKYFQRPLIQYEYNVNSKTEYEIKIWGESQKAFGFIGKYY